VEIIGPTKEAEFETNQLQLVLEGRTFLGMHASIVGGCDPGVWVSVENAATGEVTGAAVTWETDDPVIGKTCGPGVRWAAVVPLRVGANALTVNATDGVRSGSGTLIVMRVEAFGIVWAWGANDFGQLGTSPMMTAFSAARLVVGGVANARQIAAGRNHGCALTADGSLRCWGDNSAGQLGGVAMPGEAVTVAGLKSRAIHVAAGMLHTCAVLVDATVWCWGDNSSGQLGDGTKTSSTIPVQVLGLTTATMVATAPSHTCALLADRSMCCWGQGYFGALGNGGIEDALAPTLVSGISGMVGIAVGAARSCAVTGEGDVFCWGDNSGGQLGDGTNQSSAVPVRVLSLARAVAISAGEGSSHTCARTDDASLYCWGQNGAGQLGDGTTINSSVPQRVEGQWLDVSVGGLHTCALSVPPYPILYCWGENSFRQLGADFAGYSTTPFPVSAFWDPKGIIAIAAGGWHTLGLQ